MENLMIDSCVFFKMIGYNNFVQKYGKEHFDMLLQMQFQSIKNIENQIKSTLNSEFFEKYSNLPFEDQIDKYKLWSSNAVNGALKQIKSIDNKLEYYGKYISEYNKKVLVERRELLNEQVCNIVKFSDVEQLINSYKLKKDSIGSGLIYKGYIDGKYKLFTNAFCYDEILNHTKPVEDKRFLQVSRQEVDDLFKHFTLIFTKSDEVLRQINDMSKDYRTETNNKNEKAMSEDINSVNDFGDSKIAAFSNLSGMVLVTHNAKDFIFDKGIGKHNTNKLNHLMSVNKNYFGTTDAKIYTTFDILNGDYEKPKIMPGYKLESIKKAGIEFSEEFEMC